MLEREFTDDEQNSLQLLSESYGLILRTTPNNIISLPVCLLPVVFNRQKIDQLFSLTNTFSELMYKVALKPDFLFQHLKYVYDLDDFTRRLVDIAKKTSLPNTFVGISRNDFLFDQRYNQFKQVEINTIGPAFICLSQKASEFHKHALAKLEIEDSILENKSGQNSVQAIAKTHQLYGSKGKILFVVRKPEYIYFDQGFMEVELWSKYGIQVERASFLEVAEHGSLGENNELFYRGFQISTVYFRNGYSPIQYNQDIEWEAREMIQMSKAIKIPNIFYHLAGIKKIQQVLYSVDTMSQFISRDKAEALMNFMIEIWGFDQIDYELVQRIRLDPQNFVLKPQREGGGNNIYGSDILAYFENAEDDRGVRQRLQEYIVMEKIQAQQHNAYVLRQGQIQYIEAFSQIGIFGIHIVQNGQVLENKVGGYLVRTKSVQKSVGASGGVSAINSIYLDNN